MLKDATKIKQNIDATLKKINDSTKKALTLDDFIEVNKLHLMMERLEVEIIDDYKNLRQSCLKGLSQFNDDYSL